MDLPDNVRLLSTAAKELQKILKKDQKNFQRLFQDIARLGFGTLPPQGRKRLRSIDAFQFDCGRFRVVYSTQGSLFMILAVFSKTDQKRTLRSLR